MIRKVSKEKSYARYWILVWEVSRVVEVFKPQSVNEKRLALKYFNHCASDLLLLVMVVSIFSELSGRNTHPQMKI